MNTLANHLDNFLKLRRQIGFKLHVPGILLRNFVRFAEQQRASVITTKLAMRWATHPRQIQQVQKAKRLGVMRRFAIYVSAMDPRTEVPAKGLLPCQYRRQAPFLYRAEDVERLIEATHRIAVKNPFNGASHATLIGLMAVTGMRVGEVIILDRDDVDLIHLAQQQGAAIGGKEAAGKIGRDLARAQVGEKEGFPLRAKRHFSV